MPQPSVVETVSKNYAIENSKAFIGSFGLKINAGTFEGRFFNLTYPSTAPAAGLEIIFTLAGVAGGVLDLLNIGGGTTVGDYQITIETAEPAPGQTQLTCTITSVSLGNIDQQCELRAKVPGVRQSWNLQLGQPNNNNFTLNYLACDPQAAYTNPLPPPATPNTFEQKEVTLTAAGAGVGSVIGTLPVTPAWQAHYAFDYEGTIAITGLNHPTVVTTNTHPVDMPGVYEAKSIELKLNTSFGPYPVNPNDPQPYLDNELAEAERPTLTIKAQAQHVALVLDQSGSMNSDGPPTRYENAKLAAQMFTHLLFAFREGVNPTDDRLGIITFTDDDGWHQGPQVSPKVRTALALTELAKAKDDVTDPTKVDFGAPDALTPIGDGLVAGLDLLDSGSSTADRALTLVLLTDGFENAGTVFVGPNDPSTLGNTIKPYSGPLGQARDDLKGILAETGRQFVIPLGAQVEHDVLQELAGPNGYLPVTEPKGLAKAFGDILQFSQEVNDVPPSKQGADPAVYISPVNINADRLIFAVLDTFAAGHELKVESFDPGTSAWVTHADPVVKTIGTDKYKVGWVPNFQAVPGKPAQWRVTHLDAANAAVPMAADQVLAYEDLHLKSDVLLDAKAYQTGDEMHLTVRIRHDDKSVLGAKVRAELIAPAVGTGEVLSALGPDFQPGKEKGRGDVLTPIGEMIGEVLRRNKWSHWPCDEPHQEPRGLFKDGTDLLHDVDNDGDYTNTFARAWKEGPHTFNLFAEGQDTDGNPFSRRMTISTFVSIKVDPKASKVRLEPVRNHPSKLRAVRVTVTPQDVRHERLGPGKDSLLFWALKDGQFEHVVDDEPAPVFNDGTYQRVVLFRWGQFPKIKVEAAGVLLPTIVIPPWILAIG